MFNGGYCLEYTTTPTSIMRGLLLKASPRVVCCEPVQFQGLGNGVNE